MKIRGEVVSVRRETGESPNIVTVSIEYEAPGQGEEVRVCEASIDVPVHLASAYGVGRRVAVSIEPR